MPAAFLPGFRSTSPLIFSTAPLTLSPSVAFFLRPAVLFLVVAGLETRPVFVVLGPRLLVVLRDGAVSTVAWIRGLVMPEEPRVCAIVG